MSSQEIIDYLSKQIFIEKNIVTYRSLSRDLEIHVNVAKNELAVFHTQAMSDSQPCAATYLLSGISNIQRGYPERNAPDDKNGDYDEDRDESENIPQTKITLVSEEILEEAKSQFTRLHGIHIYSLAPSPIRDAGLLCAPTENVRRIDNSSRGADLAVIVGKIVNLHVQAKSIGSKNGKATQPPALSSTAKVKVNAVSSLKETKDVEKKQKEEKGKDQTIPDVEKKPKATGKLDFSKAKVKMKEVKQEDTQVEKTDQERKIPVESTSAIGSTSVKPIMTSKDEPKRKSRGDPLSDSEDTSLDKLNFSTANSRTKMKHETNNVELVANKIASSKTEESKRGLKRKSNTALLSDSESSSQSKPPSRIPSGPRVKKGIVLSDDDDDIPQRSRRKSKLNSAISSDIDSEAQRDLEAMMNVDNDQVERVSRVKFNAHTETDGEEVSVERDSDVEMAEENLDVAPKPKSRKKKEKKVIPLGRNGLKKKRIVKSRTKVDDKGYIATEDYSSYESVDEEEPEEPVKRSKAKGKSLDETLTNKDSVSVASGPSKAKASAKAAKPAPSKSGKPAIGKQKSLNNFFGAKENK